MARHHAKLPQIPEGMLLTVIKDTDCIYGDDTVHLPAGTVVMPYGFRPFISHTGSHKNSVVFYYSENKEDFERSSCLLWILS